MIFQMENSDSSSYFSRMYNVAGSYVFYRFFLLPNHSHFGSKDKTDIDKGRSIMDMANKCGIAIGNTLHSENTAIFSQSIEDNEKNGTR